MAIISEVPNGHNAEEPCRRSPRNPRVPLRREMGRGGGRACVRRPRPALSSDFGCHHPTCHFSGFIGIYDYSNPRVKWLCRARRLDVGPAFSIGTNSAPGRCCSRGSSFRTIEREQKHGETKGITAGAKAGSASQRPAARCAQRREKADRPTTDEGKFGKRRVLLTTVNAQPRLAGSSRSTGRRPRRPPRIWRPCLWVPSNWVTCPADAAGMASRVGPQPQLGGQRPSRVTELQVHGRIDRGAAESVCRGVQQRCGVWNEVSATRGAGSTGRCSSFARKSWVGHVCRRTQLLAHRLLCHALIFLGSLGNVSTSIQWR